MVRVQSLEPVTIGLRGRVQSAGFGLLAPIRCGRSGRRLEPSERLVGPDLDDLCAMADVREGGQYELE